MIILLLPLFIFEYSLFPFVFPRTIVFRLLVEIALVCYLGLLFIQPSYRWRRPLPIVFAWGGLLATLVVFSIGNLDWYHSFWSSIERSEGILTWMHLTALLVIIVGTVRSRDDWQQLFQTIIVTGWLQVLYGLAQYFNLPFAFNSTGARLSGTLGNPTFMARWLIFITFLSALMLADAKRWFVRFQYCLLIALSLFLVWHTQTRGAILAVTLSAVYISLAFTWGHAKKTMRYGAIIGIIVILLFGFFVKINDQGTWVQSSGTLNRLASINLADVSTQNRLIVWRVGWKAFLTRPLTGWGWENFNIAFNRYFDPVITRDVGSRPWYDRAHNIIVEYGVALGALGLAALINLYIWVFVALKRAQKLNNLSAWGYILLSGSWLVYFVQNLFVFDNLNSYLWGIIFLGYVQWLSLDPKSDGVKKTKKAGWPKLLAGAATIGCLAAMAALGFWWNIRPALADYYTIQGIIDNKQQPLQTVVSFQKAFEFSPPANQELRFILVQHARDQIAQKGLNQETEILGDYAVTEMNKTIRVAPYAVQNYLILSELYLLTADTHPDRLVQAELLMHQADKLAPRRYQVYSMLGRIKISQKQYPEAVTWFQQAVLLNEQFAESHWNLAIAYILSQHAPLAQAELDRAADLGFNVYSHDNVNRLLDAYQDSHNLPAIIDFLRDLIRRFPDNNSYQQALSAMEQLEQLLETKK